MDSLRCGANCLECTGELAKIRGWSCRFKEMYYDAETLRKKRKEEFEAKLASKSRNLTKGDKL